jgi:apolipoprotein N-acyltransferase
MIALLCALAGGAMFYLGFGLDSIWALAWLAPAPLLWLAMGETPRWQLFLASLAAAACGQVYLVQVYWGQLPAAMLMSWFAAYALLFAMAVLMARSMMRRLPPLLALLAFPALWTVLEYGNSFVSVNGSYGAFAYASMGFPAAIQAASLFGLYAVTFLMCLFAAALAMLVRGGRMAGWVGLGICAAALVFGFVRLAAPQGPSVQAAALSDWDARRRATKSLDLAASAKLVAEYEAAARAEADKGARLIVIPETSLPFDPAWRAALVQPFADLARARGVTLVVGAMGVKPFRNVALSFLPDGAGPDYDKRHLLPPGEDKFTPGRHAGLMGGNQAVEICKDMDFERMLRSDMRQGVVRIMAVPANDFVTDDWIHARMAVMRGVENGFALVRAASNGIETISDAQGRVLASARTYTPGLSVIRARVPLGPGPTLYTSIGDVFAWACLALAAVLVALAFVKRRA